MTARAREAPAARGTLAAAGLLIVYAAMAIGATREKSPAFDEVAHITAGVSYWTQGDFRLQPENGNWPQRLIGLGVLTGGHRFPSTDHEDWRYSDVWQVGDRFFAAKENPPGEVVLRGRAAVVVVAVLLGALVFVWSRAMFGAAGGWVSLALFAFSPTMLAHGAIATSDLMAAAFFTAATGAVWWVTHRLSAKTLALSCFAVGGLFLTKFSAPIIVPVALLLVVVRLSSGIPIVAEWRGSTREIVGVPRMSAAFALVGVVHVAAVCLLIWASFGFQFDAMSAPSADSRLLMRWDQLISRTGPLANIVTTIRDWHLLPEAWLYGFSYVMFFSQSRVSFLNGAFSNDGGLPGFFPYTAMVKETIPALVLIAIALVWIAGNAAAARRDGAQRALFAGPASPLPLMLLVAVYWGFAISSNLNIGHRHLLPIIPATYILAGIGGRAFSRTFSSAPLRRRLGTVIAGLLAWHGVESLRIAPNYLAYFNQVDGGPREAYRHLVDSSLDWGQDLPGLKRWLDARDPAAAAEPVYFSYFGSIPAERYGIAATHLPGFWEWTRPHRPERLRGGFYCLSATMLQGTYLHAAGPWTPRYETEYQIMRANMQVYDAAVSDSTKLRALIAQHGDAFWVRTFSRFEDFRLSRLAAFLRAREPVANIGYSILIYRLSDDEVRTALEGPTPR